VVFLKKKIMLDTKATATLENAFDGFCRLKKSKNLASESLDFYYMCWKYFTDYLKKHTDIKLCNEIDENIVMEYVIDIQDAVIAIGESYDSNDYKNGTGGIDVAFRFLMHEYYSKDLSKKIKTALHIRMKNGEHIVAGTIYGYRKNDDGKWEPEPEPAEVVRQIFKMALDGLTTSQIRDNMFESRYPTPREYAKIKRGKSRQHIQRQNNLLSGKVVCGCCGFALPYGTAPHFRHIAVCTLTPTHRLNATK